jgi:outer membrane receptor protein involved in Fe transport
MERQNAFVRLSYDVTDNVNAYAEWLWGTSDVVSPGVPNFFYGDVVIQPDNAFIPAELRPRVTSAFNLGTLNGDFGLISGRNERTLRRYVGGFEGSLDVFNTAWNWDAYYARSEQIISMRTFNDINTPRFRQALDSVRDANGRIVCRVNSDASTANDAPGCIPYNVMGRNVNSAEAIAYINGGGFGVTRLAQDVFSASATGEPFSTWAGPVSLALSAEHRKEKVTAFVSALSNASAFFSGNFKATNGKYSVTEGAVELVIPLAKDEAWAKAFDVSLAARATDYSTSGYVTTWKAGASYQMIDDLRLRGTYSRDIRAPNIGDLFSAGSPTNRPTFDPAKNVSPVVNWLNIGNPNLKPEKADTLGLGIVYTSSWISGLNASVDFYNINIKGAIAAISGQDLVIRCFNGETALCANVDRDAAGNLVLVRQIPINILSQKSQGLDFELSYGFDLADIMSDWGGSVSLRGLSTYVIKSNSADLGVVNHGAGGLAGLGIASGTYLYTPKITWNVTGAYTLDAFTAALTVRGFGGYKYNPDWIECTTGCPVSAGNRLTIDDNDIPGRTYFDVALSYKLLEGTTEVFFTSQNVFNQGPPPASGDFRSGIFSGPSTGILTGAYDTIGRVFRAGVRFKM